MAHQVHVGLSLSDWHIVGVIRGLLAAKTKYRITSLNSGLQPAEPLPAATIPFGRVGDAFAGVDAVLCGPEDLARWEEDDPERFSERHDRTKVILVLGSVDLLDAMDVLRVCDGMVVTDVNLARIGEIIDLAMLGYFVIPCQLMRNLGLAGGPLRRDVLLQMNSPERQVLELLGRGCSNEVIAKEMRTTEATVKRAVRKILKHLHYRDQSDEAVLARRDRTGQTSEIGSKDGDGIAPAAASAKWRKTLRDDSGVSPIEYVLFTAVLGIWAAIGLEALSVTPVANVAPPCAQPTAAQCQTVDRAANQFPGDVRNVKADYRAPSGVPSDTVAGDAEPEPATRIKR